MREKGPRAEASVSFPFIAPSCPVEMRKYARWEVSRFKSIKKLGAGLASNVYLASCQLSGFRVALKVRLPLPHRPRLVAWLAPRFVVCSTITPAGAIHGADLGLTLVTLS